MKKRSGYYFCLCFIYIFFILFITGCSSTKITIVYHISNEDVNDSVTLEKNKIEKLELPQPEKDGYEFEGWYLDSSFSKKYQSNELVEGINELYAKWSINEYTVKVHNEDDTVREYKFNYGAEIVLEQLTKDDYVFDGYYTDKELTKKLTLNTMPSKDIDLYTKFTKNTFKLTILASSDDAGCIEGETVQFLTRDEVSQKVKAKPYLGYKFVKWSNDSIEDELSLSINQDTIIMAMFTIDCLELPVVEVYTENRATIISKEEYIKCNVSISNTDYEYTFDSIGGKIRGRGNSTWGMPKKPYKLKFDNKVNLFGNGNSKTWTLIANYLDPSLLRNYFAYKIGELIDCDYTTTSVPVDLFINGEYQGVYLICEQNEVDEERVNIDSTYELDSGFLLEMDCLALLDGEILGTTCFSIYDKYFIIKSPEMDDGRYNSEVFNYIYNYIYDAFTAVKESSWDNVCELIDVYSFAKGYILDELMKSEDVGEQSFFIYKDKNGKLCRGPIWDYDHSSGVSNMVYNLDNSEFLWAKDNPVKVPEWYYYLLGFDEFKTIVSKCLEELYISVVEEIDSIKDDVLGGKCNSFERNFIKFDTLKGTNFVPTPISLLYVSTWKGHVIYLQEWLLKSLDYMYNYYVDCSEKAYSIKINTDDNYTTSVFNTNDLSYPVIVLEKAWSRSGQTGELLKDGNGQIIFKVNVKEGYKVKNISIDDNTRYVSLEVLDDSKYVYKITGISGNIVVDVELEEDIPEDSVLTTFNITFVTDSNVSIMVYEGKDYSIDGTITNSYELADISGDGQVNFKVILEDGYMVDSINITGGYKALKGPSDTGTENVYRITKVTSNLSISVTVREN